MNKRKLADASTLLKNRIFLASLTIFITLLGVYLIPTLLGVSQNPIYHRSGLSVITEPARIEGQGTIDPNDGFTAQALGRQAANSWLAGNAPYWNSYEGIGTPLAGGMQSAAFFPLTILLRLHNGFIYIHFLLQLLAGIMMFLFLSKLRLRYSLAVLGGILFALNGAFAWLTNAPFNAIAFLPMLMLGVELAVTQSKKHKPGGWWLIAIALCLSLYCGFPETAFLNAIFAAGWGLVRLWQLDQLGRRYFVKKAVAGGAVGLLLSAPILIMFIGYLSVSTTGGHEAGGYAYVGLSLKTLPALVMPYIFGPIFAVSDPGAGKDLLMFWSNVGGYLTAPLVFMAVVGFFSKTERALKLYLVAFSVIVILKIFSFKPIAFLLNLVPGMDMIAFYRYSIPALSFALIVLALFGLRVVMDVELSRRKTIIIMVASIVFLSGLTLYARELVLAQLPLHPAIKYEAVVSAIWAIGTISVMGLSVLMKPRIRYILLVAVLLIDAIVMFSVPYFSWPKTSSIDYQPVAFIKNNIGLSRFYTLGPIAPNYGSYFDIASINVNDLPVPKNWSDHIEKKLDRNAFALVFTGYSRTDPTGPTALEEFANNLHEYENVGVKYLMTNKGQVSPEVVSKLNLTQVFVNDRFAVYQLPSTKPFYETDSECQLSEMTRTKLMAYCESGGKLIRRELSLPGWTVKVNGREQLVSTENDIFQSVAIPAGKSEVTFTYTPPHIQLGFLLFSAGALWLVIYFLLRRVVILK